VTSNIIGRLKNFPVWLARCRHCRGFGVQSPWAYAFIRYVIGERWPYYAYKELERTSGKAGWNETRLNRLFFRISNYVRADNVLDFSSGEHIYTMYIKAASRKSNIIKISADMTDAEYSALLGSVGPIDFVVLSLEGQWRVFIDEVRRRSHDRTLLVVRDINRDSTARRSWKEIVGDAENTVTFDLYYCGIVFFDKKRYKQNYIVNF